MDDKPTYRPGQRALRRGRVSMPGQIYHVTIVTDGRAPLFTDSGLAGVVMRRLHDRALLDDAVGLCCVVMPDHLHWLLQLGRAASLSQLVGRFKALSARDVNRRRKVEARGVWQRGFHDHALRREENVEQVARYIADNPLRAGLCRSLANYPYWNAAWDWDF
ncbi:transposase [Solimonas sp. C16B3]|uniref:Transposase n=2 Tax=Solimonas marina TaxID=2714601 RepID=A0A970B5A7_9GAMM|nr:transposase [Solimonas marina]